MLKHDDLWRAIDELASRHGLTASGLARKAGLDATTFNRSKRITASGRRRWPSTESLAKALEAVGTSLGAFVALLEAHDKGARTRHLPIAAQSAAAASSAFSDAGKPQGAAWKGRQLTEMFDFDGYAIEVEGNGKGYNTVVREGALVVAVPHVGTAPGDRVIVRTASAELVIAELIVTCPEGVKIKPLGVGERTRKLTNDQIAAVHRIVWAEQ